MAAANCENLFPVTSSSSRWLGGLLKAKTDGGVIMGWFQKVRPVRQDRSD